MSPKERSKISTKKRKSPRTDGLSNAGLCALATAYSGVLGAKIIRPKEVETAAWVRLKCQYGCSGYGQCLVCPPYTPAPDAMRKVLDCYSRALLLHCDPNIDVKAMIAQLEREIFLKGAWKAFGLGAGPCSFCGSCSLDDQTCRHPEQARPSMEACGIDVYSTAHNAGFPIEVVKNTRQCPNYYALVLVD